MFSHIIQVILFNLRFIVTIILLNLDCSFASTNENIITTASLNKKNYNIILITIDALRADHLGCYGYFRNTSPNIDKLAQKGILFESAFANAGYTLPSMISIHTSLYPQSHNVLYDPKDKLSSRIKTMAEILNDSEYKTVYFVYIEDPGTDPNIGFGRGFDHIEDVLPYHLTEDKGEKQRIKIFNWIKNLKKENVFLNYHDRNIHAPYLPSYTEYKMRFVTNYKGNIVSSLEKLKRLQFNLIKQDFENPQSKIYEIFRQKINSHPEFFQGRFSQKKFIKLEELRNLLPLQKKMDFWKRYSLGVFFWRNVDKNNPSDVQHLKDLYDACILEFDQEFIGPLVDKLKSLNLYDKTMIIITSDHGEEFMEHTSLEHRAAKLYDELIHIPLIIKLPKDIPYKQSRIKELVQSIDIMPTILDIFGIPIPKQAQGISLKGLWEAKADAPRNEYVYAKSPTLLESIRSKNHKLIYYLSNNQHELYDLNKDPQEKNNIYNQGPEIAKKLEEDFHKWRKSLPSYIDEERDFPPEIDEATRERIKRTGYW